MNLQKLVSSEASYQKFRDKTLESVKNNPEQQNLLRNIILFCKQVFSSNTNLRKKYLCLLLIKDIFEQLNSDYYERLIDEYLALKLLHIIQAHIDGKNRESRSGNEDKEVSEKVYSLALETVVFWAKRLSSMSKSAFAQVYEELKKMKLELPSNFTFYRKEQLIQLWKTSQKLQLAKETESQLLSDLNRRFQRCKDQLEKSINESVANDQQVNTKPVIESLREYLLFFFDKYRELEHEEAELRDVAVVCFHILNNLYKRVCNQIRISIQEMISLTKETFQAVYPPQYDSVDRMDMIELAGVFKYNALSVFQRIHQRIEKEDAILGPFRLNLNLEQTEKPPLPSTLQGIGNSGRLGLNQKFTR